MLTMRIRNKNDYLTVIASSKQKQFIFSKMFDYDKFNVI